MSRLAIPELLTGTMLIVVILINGPARAQVFGQDTWIAGADGQTMIMTANGDLYHAGRDLTGIGVGPWSSGGNVFAHAGIVSEPLAGIASPGSDVYVVLTEDGDTIVSGVAEYGGPGWHLAENIFTDAAIDPAGDRFIAVANMPGGGNHRSTIYALTEWGNIFGWSSAGNPRWPFLGNVFDNSPVQIELRTWGRVKADRR